MAYKRITKDVYEIQVRYSAETGYECVCEEETLKEAMDRLHEYRENEPQYQSRIIKVRRRIDE